MPRGVGRAVLLVEQLRQIQLHQREPRIVRQGVGPVAFGVGGAALPPGEHAGVDQRIDVTGIARDRRFEMGAHRVVVAAGDERAQQPALDHRVVRIDGGGRGERRRIGFAQRQPVAPLIDGRERHEQRRRHADGGQAPARPGRRR